MTSPSNFPSPPTAAPPEYASPGSDDLLSRFEHGWQGGAPPDLDAFLGASPGRPSGVLADLVCIDLEYRLKRGEAVRVEDYLARYPELAAGGHLADLAAWEFELRQRRGQGAVDEYLARFPTVGPDLRTRLEDIARQNLASTVPLSANGVPTLPVEPDGFHIVEELGRGAMGVVYKARQVELGRQVALKMILANVGGE